MQGFIYLSNAPILSIRSLSLVALLLQALLLDHLQNPQGLLLPGKVSRGTLEYLMVKDA